MGRFYRLRLFDATERKAGGRNADSADRTELKFELATIECKHRRGSKSRLVSSQQCEERNNWRRGKRAEIFVFWGELEN